MASEDPDLSQDVLFDVLSNRRRRYTLFILKTEGAMELTELAERVAARENDIETEDLSKKERKRVYVSLYQSHVPKLEDAGLVKYDEDDKVVSLHSDDIELGRFMREEPGSFPWQYVYMTLALVGAVSIGLTIADVGPFAVVPETSVAVGLVLALVVVSSFNILYYMFRRTESSFEFLNQ